MSQPLLVTCQALHDLTPPCLTVPSLTTLLPNQTCSSWAASHTLSHLCLNLCMCYTFYLESLSPHCYLVHLFAYASFWDTFKPILAPPQAELGASPLGSLATCTPPALGPATLDQEGLPCLCLPVACCTMSSVWPCPMS